MALGLIESIYRLEAFDPDIMFEKVTQKQT